MTMESIKRQYVVSLLSLNQNVLLSFPDFETFGAFAQVLEHELNEQEKLATISPYQPNSLALRQRLSEFLAGHGKRHANLKKMINYLNKVPDGHFFLVVDGEVNDTQQVMDYSSLLHSYHKTRGIETGTDVTRFDWGQLLVNYNMQIFGHQRKVIGAFDNEAKTCRFCATVEGLINARGHKVTFKSRSHAISEALGNKNVEVRDECDSCNQYFSEQVEPSLVNFLAFFRALHGLDGKKGKKKLVGDKFSLDPVTGMKLELDQSFQDPHAVTKVEAELDLRETFVPQDLYRCLVKFLLSVLPKQELANLGKTLRWLNKEFDADALPLVSTLQHANFFSPRSTLIYFKKKVDDHTLPELVGEFHYADHIFTFLVPFCRSDQGAFLENGHVEHFCEVFHSARAGFDWAYTSFDSIKVNRVRLRLNIEGIKVGQNNFVTLPGEKSQDQG